MGMPRYKPRQLVGKYRSGSEARFADHLHALGVVFEYEPRDKKVTYAIERQATYLPDFIIKDTTFILEVKGYLSPSDRAKYIRIKKSNPDIDIRFVFDRASNKLNKTSKTTYADWATKSGFQWCEKVIPISWIKGTLNERAPSKAASTRRSSAPRKQGVHLAHGGPHRPRHLSAGRVNPRNPKGRVEHRHGHAQGRKG